MRNLLTVPVVAMTLSVSACARETGPELGEIMTLTQMRHAKLWYAGRAQNWALADYELDELEEGLDDVVRFHPTHKDAPLPLSQLVPKIMNQPVDELRRAIKAGDGKAFEVALAGLTKACNSCHQASHFGFNVVRQPEESSWFSNQDFAPPHQ